MGILLFNLRDTVRAAVSARHRRSPGRKTDRSAADNRGDNLATKSLPQIRSGRPFVVLGVLRSEDNGGPVVSARVLLALVAVDPRVTAIPAAVDVARI